MAKWTETKFGGENRTRIDELIRIVDYRKNKKPVKYRFIDEPVMYAIQWLPIYKDGKPMKSQKGKDVRIPFNITNFDVDTETFDDTKKCPFVEVAEKIQSLLKNDDDKKQLNKSTGYYAQAINRRLQENPDSQGKPTKTERESGLKDSMDTESFTPVEVHQLNFTIGQNLDSITETNTVKNKKTGKSAPKHVADPKYGKDVFIKYDEGGTGQGKYKVQGGERTPIEEEEEKYLLWDIKKAIKETTLTRKQAKIEAERILAEFMKSVKGKKKSSDDDDDDDSELPDDIEDNEEIKPKKGSKKTKKPDPDEDDEDSDDSDDEDSDDEDDEDSSSKKKKTVKKTGKKKPDPDEDDEDEDSDDEDEDSDDDEEDTKKSSKKKTVKKTAKKKKDEDDDDDSDDEDDDDEEEKTSKKKTTKKKPAVKEVKGSKKKKKDEDEDTDDEDDEDGEFDISDLDDDEDDDE